VEEIVAGGLEPGDVLPAEGLMLDHYEVGRASLREALRLLEAQGLVTLKSGPGGGPVVGAVDAANLGRTATLYFRLAGATCGVLAEAMLVLDPWLAELAAERADPKTAAEALGACVAEGDRALGNNGKMWLTAPEFHDTFQADHHRVAEAIGAGEPALARRLAHEHMECIIKTVSDRAPWLLDRVIEWR
jgi:DNA-binding FadR family transcriptional regulator